MERIDHHHPAPAASGELVVRRPREADALGKALRRTFGTGCALPDDWLRSLALLDRH